MREQLENKLNYLKKCSAIQDVTRKYYRQGLTTYSGVWREYIKDVFFVGYVHYINNILSEGNLHSRIAELEDKIEDRQKRKKNQLNLFD